MQHVETDNHKHPLSVELKAQSVQTSADNAPTDNNENIGDNHSVKKHQAGNQNSLSTIAHRTGLTSGSEVNTFMDFEMQKKKYIEWVNSGDPPKHICLMLPDEDGNEQSINHSVPFVDVFRLKTIHENYPLRFWSCDPQTKQREFILFEYSIPRCKFKGVVQDLNNNFTIGLNIKRESQTDYSVTVTNGLSSDVRNRVQKQLRYDFESIYGDDSSVRALSAATFLTFKKLLAKIIGDPFREIRAGFKLLVNAIWKGQSTSALLNIIGVSITLLIIVSPMILSVQESDRSMSIPEIDSRFAGLNATSASINGEITNDLSETPAVAAKAEFKEPKRRENQVIPNNTDNKQREETNPILNMCETPEYNDPFFRGDFAIKENPPIEEKSIEENKAETIQPNSENLSCVDKLSSE